jgi:hypothetical protein
MAVNPTITGFGSSITPASRALALSDAGFWLIKYDNWFFEEDFWQPQ